MTCNKKLGILANKQKKTKTFSLSPDAGILRRNTCVKSISSRVRNPASWLWQQTAPDSTRQGQALGELPYWRRRMQLT